MVGSCSVGCAVPSSTGKEHQSTYTAIGAKVRHIYEFAVRFYHGDIVPSLLQVVGARETGDAGAHDDEIECNARLPMEEIVQYRGRREHYQLRARAQLRMLVSRVDGLRQVQSRSQRVANS